MHSSYLCIFLISLLLAFSAIAQPPKKATHKKQSNNTLLWRISGKGLKQHSYLFGTYHTRDPRAFQFTDSMVAAFRNCAAFFGELHLDSAARDYYQEYLTEAPIDIAKLFASATSRNNYPIPDDHPWSITPFGGEDDSLTTDSYPVFLDAWLFRHAQLQGKRVGGLEELATQLDEFTFDQSLLRRRSEPEEGKNDNTELVATFVGFMQEGLMEFYQNQDLESIEQTFNWIKELEGGKRAIEKMLDYRNIGMVERIDSLIRLAPSFITMGCAHLPGNNGVIALLRKRGYTVTPVHSLKSGATIADDTASLVRSDWEKYPVFHGSSTIELPLQPVEFSAGTRLPDRWSGKLTMASDVGAGVNYFLAELTLPPHQLVTNWPKLMRACLATLSDSSNQLIIGEVLPDTSNGLHALTVTAASERLHARLMMRNHQLYLLLAASDADLSRNNGVNRFFRSFRFAPRPESRWETLTFDTGRCEVQFPSNRHSFSTSLGVVVTPQQGAVAEHDGTIFTITVEQIPAYAWYQSDSAEMVRKIFELRSQNHSALPTILMDSVSFTSGFAQLQFTMQKGEGGMRGKLVRNGLFEYLLTASHPTVMPSQSSVDSFFHSLRFLSPAPLRWQPFSSYVLGFKVDIPGEPKIINQSGNESQHKVQYDEATTVIMDDTLNGGRFIVDVFLLNQYLQLPTLDSLFLSEVAYPFRDDTILSNISVTTSKGIAREYIYGQSGNVVATRYRLVQHGRHVFLLSYLGLQKQLHDSSVNRFFNSFQFIGDTKEWDLSADKIPQFFNHILIDEDSASSARMIVDENNTPQIIGMESHDTPFIYAAIDSLLAIDGLSESQENVLISLVGWLEQVHDILTPQFLQERYSSFPNESMRTATLNTLMAIGSETSLQTLARLLQRYQPDGDQLYYLSNAGIDSGTTGVMYPDILNLAEIESYQESLYRLTSQALDKNIISPAMLLPYRELLLNNFRNHLNVVINSGNDDDEEIIGENPETIAWQLVNLTNCLGTLPAASDLDSLMWQAVGCGDSVVAVAASIALLRHGYAVDKEVFQRFATFPANRPWLYSWMQKNGLAEHFPSEFRSGRAMAEGQLASWVGEEYGSPEVLELLTERKLRWKEKEATGYLFRYSWDSDTSNTNWEVGLVIATLPEPDLDAQILTDELEGLTINEQFQYLMELLKEQQRE